MTDITYPPEMLPKSEDGDAEVLIQCTACDGGFVQETNQEDERWEMVSCVMCGGTGFVRIGESNLQ